MKLLSSSKECVSLQNIRLKFKSKVRILSIKRNKKKQNISFGSLEKGTFLTKVLKKKKFTMNGFPNYRSDSTFNCRFHSHGLKSRIIELKITICSCKFPCIKDSVCFFLQHTQHNSLKSTSSVISFRLYGQKILILSVPVSKVVTPTGGLSRPIK